MPRTAVTTTSIRSSSGREGLHDHRRALAAPDASGAESEALLRPAQGVEQMDRHTGSGRSEWVADGNRAAVHVGLRAVESELPLDGEILRRKRLVHLHQIHLLELHPGLLQRLARRGRGADAHVLRLDPDYRPGHDAAQRLQAVGLGIVRARDDRRRGTVHDPGGVARGNEPVLPEIWLEGEQHLERGIGSHVLIGAILSRLTLLSLHRHRYDLVLEDARVPGLFGAALRRECHLVHVFPGQLILLRQPLGGLGHGEAALRVLERFPEEVFERGRRPESQAPARTAYHVGGLAHGLRAAGEHRLRFTQENELSAFGDRFEPRATQPVHRDGRDLDRQSRLESDVPGAVDRVGGRLEGVAEDAVAHVGRRDTRALERVLRGDGAQLDRREVFQRAPEGAEAGPDTREEHDVCIGTLGLHWGEAPRETRGISGGSGEGGRALRPKVFYGFGLYFHTKYAGTPVATIPRPIRACTGRATIVFPTIAV